MIGGHKNDRLVHYFAPEENTARLKAGRDSHLHGRAVASCVADDADGNAVQEGPDRRLLHLRAPVVVARRRAAVVRGAQAVIARFRPLKVLETLGAFVLEALPALDLEKAYAVRRWRFHGAVPYEVIGNWRLRFVGGMDTERLEGGGVGAVGAGEIMCGHGDGGGVGFPGSAAVSAGLLSSPFLLMPSALASAALLSVSAGFVFSRASGVVTSAASSVLSILVAVFVMVITVALARCCDIIDAALLRDIICLAEEVCKCWKFVS